MANFPQYQYQPQQMGYQPQQMQPVYQQYQQPMQNQQEAQLFCRPVASADEARGVPVDFTGRPMVFTHLSAGKIYVKVFDQGSGSAIFREFRMYEEPAQETAAQTAAAYAPLGVVDEIKNLKEHLAALQDEIRGLKRRRTQNTEVTVNED